ncbi:hypothetical protein ACH5RR_020393 [Cinchona calisaya]|uniref:FBD domain-containing protein n=1 Tax=Cinchona calisaya TaxID=153742 RepID=A0ABD2ZFC2_9GENT
MNDPVEAKLRAIQSKFKAKAGDPVAKNADRTATSKSKAKFNMRRSKADKRIFDHAEDSEDSEDSEEADVHLGGQDPIDDLYLLNNGKHPKKYFSKPSTSSLRLKEEWRDGKLSSNEPRGRKFSIAAGHHAHLKLMELQGFRGTRNEIELASYVLRTASRLKGLCLFTSYECFRSNFSKTEHKDYVIDDDERQLTYKELEGQTISTRAVLDIQAGFFIVEE